MSIKCVVCYSDNSDDAVVCSECGAALPKKKTSVSWKVRCPIDGKIIDASDVSFHCDPCRYPEDIVNREACLPFKEAVHKEEAQNGTPELLIQPIEAVIDKQHFAFPSSEPSRYIGESFTVADKCVLGRAGDVANEYFKEDLYISEKHCEIIYENNNWYVKRLSKNPTVVDGVPVELNGKRKVHSGSLLQLSDRLLLLTAVQADIREIPDALHTEQADSSQVAAWVVKCPNCGKRYTVENPSDRIPFCDNCDDFYRNDISDVKAVKINVDR